MKGISFRFRLILSMCSLVAILGLFFSIYFYRMHYRERQQGLDSTLQNIAIAASCEVDPDVLLVSDSIRDKEFPLFLATLERLQLMQKRLGLAYVYTMVPTPGSKDKVHFVIDSEGPDQLGEPYKDAPPEILEVLRTGKVMTSAIYTDQWGRFKSAFAPIKDSGGQVVGVLGVDRKVEDYFSALGHGLWLVWLVSTAAMLGAFGVAYVLSGRLASRVQNLSRVAAEVAAGNLGIDVKVEYADEIGRLQKSLREMVIGLRRLISHITAGSQELNAAALVMESSVKQTADGASEVARVLEEMTQGADASAKSAVGSVNRLQEIGASVRASDEDSLKAVTSAEAALRQVASGAEQLSMAANQMLEARAGAFNSTQAVALMQRQAAETGQTALFIENLFEQIKLLALNAQIEAARAGEAGRGFTVVAQKITALSEDTAKFVSRIQEVSARSQEEAAQTAASLQRLIDQVAASAQALTEVEKMTTEVTSAVVQANRLMAASHDRAGAIRQLVEETVESSSEQAAVSEEIAASIEEISASSSEQAAVAEQINGAAQHLRGLAEELSKAVMRFRVDAE